MQKFKTHFEQISVAFVKKIAKEDASNNNREKDRDDTTIATSKLKPGRRPSRNAGWRELYKQVLLEVDEKKLRHRIAAAETAISNRLGTISGVSNHFAERQAIEDALSSLSALKRISL
jgi:hypothetical protein